MKKAFVSLRSNGAIRNLIFNFNVEIILMKYLWYTVKRSEVVKQLFLKQKKKRKCRKDIKEHHAETGLILSDLYYCLFVKGRHCRWLFKFTYWKLKDI